ncbi:MAG: addiction module protein [Nitrospira sp.]|nr:addiction module protein [Nitrospira sp.]
MKFNQIEAEALNLSKEERAELAQKLLLSLDTPSEKEIAEDWLMEAQRRARDLDEGIVQPISAEKVRRKAQALLR